MSTLDNILSETEFVLCSKGLSGLSMGPLAKKLGLAKASLFHHVSSKDDLILKICQKLHHDLEELALHIEEQESPDKALNDYFIFHSSSEETSRSLMSVLISEAHNFSNDVREEISAIRQTDSHILASILYEGRQQGWVFHCSLSEMAFLLQENICSAARIGWLLNDKEAGKKHFYNFLAMITPQKKPA